MPSGFCILKTQPNSIESGIIKKIASEKTLAMTSWDLLEPAGYPLLHLLSLRALQLVIARLPLVIARAFSEAIS